jgi:hypothetical protein
MRYKDWTGNERTYFVNVPTFPITEEMVKRSKFKLIKAQRKLERFHEKNKAVFDKEKELQNIIFQCQNIQDASLFYRGKYYKSPIEGGCLYFYIKHKPYVFEPNVFLADVIDKRATKISFKPNVCYRIISELNEITEEEFKQVIMECAKTNGRTFDDLVKEAINADKNFYDEGNEN